MVSLGNRLPGTFFGPPPILGPVQLTPSWSLVRFYQGLALVQVDRAPQARVARHAARQTRAQGAWPRTGSGVVKDPTKNP